MIDPKIVDTHLHNNTETEPYVVALVDDPEAGDTKLVIIFGTEGHTAVLSLDSLIEEEDISDRGAGKNTVARLDNFLRPLLVDNDEQ